MTVYERVKDIGRQARQCISLGNESLNQTLALILLTVFVLGCQLTLWLNKQSSMLLNGAYVVLLILYLAKTWGVLLKEIKEVTHNAADSDTARPADEQARDSVPPTSPG